MPGLTPETGRSLTAEDLLNAYNSQGELVRSLQGSAVVRAQGGSELNAKARDSRPTPVLLSFQAPASLRMTGVIPFSARRTFDLSSDGKEFRLLVPDGNLMRFFVGPVDAPATSSNPRENLRPQPIVDALHWFHAKLADTAAARNLKSANDRTIELELSTPTPVAAQAEFDLRNGTVSRFTILDGSKKMVIDIHYSDWQRLPVTEKADAPICFPKRIRVSQPQQNLLLEMKMVSFQMNLAIPGSQLQLLPPRGISVTRLTAHRGNHP